MPHIKQQIRNIAFILILLATFSNSSIAQKFSLKHITVSDGLPSNETFCIYQKNVGELLIGTEYGLVQYDGEEFTQIPFEDKKYSGSMVFEIKSDLKNVLWIKTYRDGLFYLEDDTLRPFKGNDFIREVIKENMLGDIQFDEKDNLWFTLPFYSDTVFKVSLKTGKTTKVPVDGLNAESKPNFVVYYLDAGTKLVVNTAEKGVCTSPKTTVKQVGNKKLITLSKKDCNPFACRNETYIDISSGFVIALYNTLLAWNKQTQKTMSFDMGSEILYLLNDNNNNILIACRSGAYLLNKKTWQLKTIMENQLVTSIIQDSEGTFWFTTNNGLVNMSSTDIYLLNFNEPGYSILTLAGDKSSNKLAVVGIENTLKIYTDKNATVRLKNSHTKKLDKISPKKMVWLNKDTLVYSHALYDAHNQTEKILAENLKGAILDIEKGEKQNTLLFAYKKGFSIFEVNTSSKTSPLPVYCPELFCRAVAQQQNKIYMGTDLGLYLFDGTNKANRIFAKSLNFQVNDIQPFGKNKIIVSTRGGGVFIVEVEGGIKQLSTDDGLSSSFCTHISVEDEKTFWVGSNKGLNRIKVEDGQYNIDKWLTEDGLISDKISDIAWTGNNLYILTDQGINYFNPKKITPSKPQLNIRLRDLKINGISRTINDNLIEIMPGERDMRFEFKNQGLRKRSNIQLRYILQGEDQIFSQTGGQSILYKDLSPGTYTLAVQAIGVSGHEMGTALNYEILVKPHFYETRTFWVMLIVIAAGFITFVIIFWLRRAEIERKRKWEYANAQLEALNLQMNPHFIFNALGNIQSLVFGDNKMLTNNFVVALSELFRKVLINANTNLITLKVEIEMLKEYIELELLRIEDKAIDYIIEVDPNLGLNSERIPPMLIQPIVENAIWHGLLPNEKKGILKIVFIKTDKGFDIEVIDNGVGIDTVNKSEANKKRRPSLGLDNVRKRITLYKGMRFGTAKMFIEDLKGKEPYYTGTKVTLHFEK